MSLKPKPHQTLNLSPPSLLALGFLAFIIFGTLLLKLPIANNGHVSWMDALFTATSSYDYRFICFKYSSSFTLFGQVIFYY